MRTALAFEFAVRSWSTDPQRCRGSKPIKHSDFGEWRCGRIIPRDIPGGVIDQLEEAAPGAAVIFRSPMWALLRGEQVTVERLESCLADRSMHKLGAEYSDLAEYEDLLLRLEVASRVQKIAVFEALLEGARHSLAAAELPRVITPFADAVADLLLSALDKWSEVLVVLQTISRRSDHPVLAIGSVSSAEVDTTDVCTGLPRASYGRDELRPSPLSWIADLTRKDSLIAIVALMPTARASELFSVSIALLALNIACLLSPKIFYWPRQSARHQSIK